MARLRIRTIKPEFFEDEKINTLCLGARYLTIGLITRADDRGRQRRMEEAIRAHVFPAGDASVKQVARWLGEVVKVGVAWAYEADGFAYLWLPHFWRHQNINRPSESDLPPHPKDPYRTTPVSEAIKEYRSEHRTELLTDPITEIDSDPSSDPLTPPRAGARSAPFLSGSKEGNQREAELDARAPLCELLADLIVENGSKRPTVGKSWHDAERLLLEADERDRAEAEGLIRWCQADSFWRANVLSMPTFRAKYDRLRLAAQREPAKQAADLARSARRMEWLGAEGAA